MKHATPISRWFYLTALLFAEVSGVHAQDNRTLHLHPSRPHYFNIQGKPAVLVGSGEHYGAVINTAFDYDTYLNTLAADGLNHTRLFTGAYVERSGDFGIGNNTLAPGEGKLLLPWKRTAVPGHVLGGTKFDLAQWDDTYFTRLKDFITKAGQRGIVVEVTLFSAHYGSGWNYSAFNPRNNVNGTTNISAPVANTRSNGNILQHQERYTRKLVRELNAFDNIYFEIQNEPWADTADLVLTRNEFGGRDDWRNTLQVVSAGANEWQRTVARWIREEENLLPKKHLVAQNISNFYYPVANPDPAVDLFNFHYALPQAATQNLHLRKAIGCNETGFAGKADSTYRRQAWRFFMAGGSLFSHLDYSFSVGFENGLDTGYTAPGGGSAALRRQLGFLKRFFDQLPLARMQPDQQLVKAAPGAQSQTLSDQQAHWVIYLEPLARAPGALQLRLPPGSYEAIWYDLSSGEQTARAPVRNNLLPVPGGMADKVVRIRKVTR